MRVFIAQISKRMNVLILTPDAVGSTLLQRLITIYMQFHGYDRPVINLHELTNGLVRYHNTHFDQEVLGKKDGGWGYHQSLEQIVDLLSSVDHYKTSRLAHYHIKNRQDAVQDQLSFYQYLNENFYIISCRRHNVFEHALSWCLTKITKKLNVYTPEEKVDNFYDLYSQGLDIDPNSLIQTLNAYKDYVKWCNDHFNVANYFYYDEHLPRIENYILGLPIFSQSNKLSWKQNFNMDFETWNQCHYLTSDLGSLALDAPDKFLSLANQAATFYLGQQQSMFLQDFQNVADPSWGSVNSMNDYNNLPQHIKQEVEQQFQLVPQFTNATRLPANCLIQALTELQSPEQKQFLIQHNQPYQQSMGMISDMVKSGVLLSAPPIKKQTLAEKKHIIKNYDHLLDVYNQWISVNPDIGQPLDSAVLDQFAEAERNRWNPTTQEPVLAVEQKPDWS